MHLSRFLSKRVTDLQRTRAPQHLQWKFFSSFVCCSCDWVPGWHAAAGKGSGRLIRLSLYGALAFPLTAGDRPATALRGTTAPAMETSLNFVCCSCDWDPGRNAARKGGWQSPSLAKSHCFRRYSFISACCCSKGRAMTTHPSGSTPHRISKAAADDGRRFFQVSRHVMRSAVDSRVLRTLLWRSV